VRVAVLYISLSIAHGLHILFAGVICQSPRHQQLHVADHMQEPLHAIHLWMLLEREWVTGHDLNRGTLCLEVCLYTFHCG
jgi:hypothetical protein